MFANSLLHERVQLIAAIDPDAYTATAYLTPAVNVGLYEQMMFVGLAGTIGASNGTITYAVHASATSGGAYAAVTGKANAALTAAGSDSDKQAIINLRGADLLAVSKSFAKGSMTVANQTSDAAQVVFALEKQDGADHVNSLMSERYPVVGVVDPDIYSPGAYDTDVVDMGKFGVATAWLLAGDVGNTSTIDGQWYQATSAAKAGEKAIVGKTTAQVDGSASPSESNTRPYSSIRAEDLDGTNGFHFAYFRMTIADTTSPETQTSDAGAIVLAGDARYGDSDANDLASVDEIVA